MTEQREQEHIATYIKTAFQALGLGSPQLWFDFARYNEALTVEVNYRRRWWTVAAENETSIHVSVADIKDYLTKEDSERRPADNSVTTILKDRGGTHGDFASNAVIAQWLREQFRGTIGWRCLNDSQRLALDEIALKIARLLSVIPAEPLPNKDQPAHNPEHWRDIQGYAKLGENACLKTS